MIPGYRILWWCQNIQINAFEMISIVIPAYNVCSYLEQCVKSVLSQSFSDYEILLIDDGSTDGTEHICDELSLVDSRIKAYHKPNGGLSDARNYGVEKSKGDYLIFLDGDDFWLGEDSLSILFQEYLKTPNFDFVGFNCKYFFPHNNRYVCWPHYSETSNRTEAIGSLVGSGLFPMSACLKIIRKDFFVNHNLFFEKGRFSEDILWFIEMLGKSNRFRIKNLYMYGYRQNVEGSISTSFSKKKFFNLVEIVKKGYTLIGNLNFNEKERTYLYSFLAYELCIIRAFQYKYNYATSTSEKKMLKDLHFLMSYTKNPKVRIVHIVDIVLGNRVADFLLSKYLCYNR